MLRNPHHKTGRVVVAVATGFLLRTTRAGRSVVEFHCGRRGSRTPTSVTSDCFQDSCRRQSAGPSNVRRQGIEPRVPVATGLQPVPDPFGLQRLATPERALGVAVSIRIRNGMERQAVSRHNPC